MKINEIITETMSGGIATVAMPMGVVQKRNSAASIYSKPKKKKKTSESFGDIASGNFMKAVSKQTLSMLDDKVKDNPDTTIVSLASDVLRMIGITSADLARKLAARYSKDHGIRETGFKNPSEIDRKRKRGERW